MSAKSRQLSTLFHYFLLTLLALISIAPIFIMLSTSFKNEVLIFTNKPVWFFFFPTVSNYVDILQGDKFGLYLFNSVVIAVTSTAITLLFGGMAAYALARMKFAGRKLMANSALIVRMMPPAVMAVPIFAIAGTWGLDKQLGGVIFFYTALNLPFAIWLLFGFVKQIPSELEEAAIMDGASAFQAFFWIIFPLMRSGFAVAAIFTFRIAWNEFILAMVLTNRSTRTLPVATTLFITDQGVEWGRIMAMGTLIVLPPLIFTFFNARQIIAGMSEGSVKG